jgi:hypothetical protein
LNIFFTRLKAGAWHQINPKILILLKVYFRFDRQDIEECFWSQISQIDGSAFFRQDLLDVMDFCFLSFIPSGRRHETDKGQSAFSGGNIEGERKDFVKEDGRIQEGLTA